MSSISEISAKETFRRRDGSHLHEAMRELYKSSTFTDVKLKVGDQIYPVHKCVMYANSPMMRIMLTADTLDKDKDIIHMKTLDPASFRLVLDFMYTDEIQVTGENVLGVLSVGDYFQIEELRRFCLNFLTKNLVPESAVEMFRAAYTFNDLDLKLRANKVIADNVADLQSELNDCELDEFSAIVLCRSGPAQKDSLWGEETALISILNWIRADLQQREQYLVKMVQSLDLVKLSPQFLRSQISDSLLKRHQDVREDLINVLLEHLNSENDYQKVKDGKYGCLTHTFRNIKALENGEKVFSQTAKFVQDVPWEVSVVKNSMGADEEGGYNRTCWTIFAHCNRKDKSEWSCDAIVNFRMIPVMEGRHIQEHKLKKRTFSNKANNVGIQHFHDWNEAMDSGYITDEGEMTIQVVIQSDPVIRV